MITHVYYKSTSRLISIENTWSQQMSLVNYFERSAASTFVVVALINAMFTFGAWLTWTWRVTSGLSIRPSVLFFVTWHLTPNLPNWVLDDSKGVNSSDSRCGRALSFCTSHRGHWTISVIFSSASLWPMKGRPWWNPRCSCAYSLATSNMDRSFPDTANRLDGNEAGNIFLINGCQSTITSALVGSSTDLHIEQSQKCSN